MVDSGKISILTLGALLLITLIVWAAVPIPQPVQGAQPTQENDNVPAFLAGTNDWTSVFRGYEVHLDNQIKYNPIVGTSMVPTYADNDLVLWVDYPTAEVEIGDIIVFWYSPLLPSVEAEGGYRAHRVCNILPDGRLETAGDRTGPDLYPTGCHGLVIGAVFTSSPGWHYP
jgi:hypothetical protein